MSDKERVYIRTQRELIGLPSGGGVIDHERLWALLELRKALDVMGDPAERVRIKRQLRMMGISFENDAPMRVLQELLQSKRNPLCASQGHQECHGDIWRCDRCNRTFCANEGTEDAMGLCDECWAAAGGGA